MKEQSENSNTTIGDPVQRLVKATVPLGVCAWRNLGLLLQYIGGNMYDSANTRLRRPSLQQARLNAQAVCCSRNNADTTEQNRQEASKPAAGIPVSFADRLEVAVSWPDINNPAQIAISRCSQ